MAKTIRMPGTRTGGVKLQTWSIPLRQGKPIEFEISMVHEPELGFVAATKDPRFRGVMPRASDIKVLQQMLSEQVEAVEHELLADAWAPCTILQTREDRRYFSAPAGIDREKMTGTNFGILLSTALSHRGRGVGNEGNVHILTDDGRAYDIHQHAPGEQIYPKDPGRLGGPPRPLDTDGVARVVLPGDPATQAKLETLIETLAQFHQALTNRLSPDGIARQGIPAPEDLTTLLADTIAATRKG